jgi:hypothetical protein
MRTELLRFNGAVERDLAIDAWMEEHGGELIPSSGGSCTGDELMFAGWNSGWPIRLCL